MSYNKEELLKLSIEERLALAGELWDSIDESLLPISEELQNIAKERYEGYLANPKDVISLEDLKSKLSKDGL
jgi:putative addiction module component (TIGR02574 family)